MENDKETEEDLSHLYRKGEQGVTVGRIVHYAEGKYTLNGNPAIVMAAIVTDINDNGSVSLTAFRPGKGTTTDLHGVRYSEKLKRGHWSWPVPPKS